MVSLPPSRSVQLSPLEYHSYDIGSRAKPYFDTRPATYSRLVDTNDASASPYHGSRSPPDPSVSIPQALVELASTAPPITSKDRQPVDDFDAVPDELDDRGEMGGKRRKPLHERAGWREMDQQRGQKRVRRRRGSSATPGEFVRYAGPDRGTGAVERNLMDAQTEIGLATGSSMVEGQTIAASLNPQFGAHGEGDLGEATDGESSGKRGKTAVDPS